MGLGEAVASVLGNYATFSGRARRSEFWWWWLALILVGAAFAAIGAAFGSGLFGDITRIGYFAFGLVTFIPTLAVSIRRLHDISKSGWWLLVAFIPVVGSLILFVLHLLPSTEGSNTYGAQPQ